MTLTNVYLAEEALSLPPEERAALAQLLLASVAPSERGDDAIRAELRVRLARLNDGTDPGLTFADVFGEPL